MQPILLLHGAIGSQQRLTALAEELSTSYIVHSFNFAGHGGDNMPEEGFSIELFASQVLQYLDDKRIKKISIFGYSMGGYVAMYLASHHPDRILKVITLATKFHWDESIAEREIKMLDAKKIEEKIPAFAKELQQRHGGQNWQMVLTKTTGLLFSLGKNNVLKTANFASIQIPCLLLLGDRDKMVSLEETVTVFKTLPQGQLGILPVTPHPLEQVNVKRLAFEIGQFVN